MRGQAKCTCPRLLLLLAPLRPRPREHDRLGCDTLIQSRHAIRTKGGGHRAAQECIVRLVRQAQGVQLHVEVRLEAARDDKPGRPGGVRRLDSLDVHLITPMHTQDEAAAINERLGTRGSLNR